MKNSWFKVAKILCFCVWIGLAGCKASKKEARDNKDETSLSDTPTEETTEEATGKAPKINDVTLSVIEPSSIVIKVDVSDEDSDDSVLQVKVLASKDSISPDDKDINWLHAVKQDEENAYMIENLEPETYAVYITVEDDTHNSTTVRKTILVPDPSSTPPVLGKVETNISTGNNVTVQVQVSDEDTDPEDIQIYILLRKPHEAGDMNWTEAEKADKNHTVIFEKVSPGTYHIFVKAEDPQGNETLSSEPTIIQVTGLI